MLKDSLFESQSRNRTRKPLTVVVSSLAHVVTAVVLIVIPLLQTQALTVPPVNTSLLLPGFEKPRPIPVFTVRREVSQHDSAHDHIPIFTAPPSIPSQIMTVDQPERPELDSLLSGARLASSGVNFGNRPVDIAGPGLVPPPTPPPPPVINARPFRTGGEVQAAKLLFELRPLYPEIAKRTRTQGAVVLEAVINIDGSIESLRVISGNPLLTQAALDAVKQWKYRPTMLNGEPTEVITTVTVTFTLH